MLPFLGISHNPPRPPPDSSAGRGPTEASKDATEVVSFHTLQFDSIEGFEAFMSSPMHHRYIGGLIDVFIGCYNGLEAECFAHVFAFVVVHSPLGLRAKILACDRGEPCQTYSGSHIEKEIREQIEGRRLTWPQFVALHAESHPGASMRDKARAWTASKLFHASVTVLLDEEVPKFKMTTLESMYHHLAAVCIANDTLRSTLGRFFPPTTFDQQEYPICWMVSVVWLLALLPRLTGGSSADLGAFVERVMNAKTVDKWIAHIEKSMTTRNVYRTWRMPHSIVDAYTSRADGTFDLRKYSDGGFPFVLLEAALNAVGITLVQHEAKSDSAQHISDV